MPEEDYNVAKDKYNKPYPNIIDSKELIEPNYSLDKVLFLGNEAIQGNTPFQPQDRFAFSPLPTNPISLEGLALVALIVQLSKTPQGQARLTRIAETYIKTCGSIIEAVQDASHSNWLTALNNQHITTAICHRIGLMDDASYIKVLDHYRSVFDKMFNSSVLTSVLENTITGVTTLVQGSKIQTPAESGASPFRAEGLGLLSSLGKVPPPP